MSCFSPLFQIGGRSRIGLALVIGALLCTTALAAPSTAGDDAYDWNQWREFWSFKPVRKVDPPATKNGAAASNPIDRFLRARLTEKGLKPAAEADRYALIRRATYDLTGLPPTPGEIRAFIADKSPDAYEKVLDRLLASPHYGEHWGRHWLDVARYVPGRISFPGVKHTAGDSHYRDYVVRAFNSDLPYDRFITEQLAGDLLPPAAERGREMDQLIAPAFLSIGAWFDQCTDPNRLRLEMIDDMVNVTTQSFMGLSVSCARCHDHKFDPIPTADYYAIGGIFQSTRIVGDFSEYWRDGRVRLLRPLAMPEEVVANDHVRQEIAAIKEQRWNLLSEAHAKVLAGWQADQPKYQAALAAIARPYVYRFEAENFDGQGNLRIAELTRDGSAVQVIETLNPTSQWVKYKLEVPQAGDYRLEALYCSEDPTPIAVQVNGTTVATDALGEPTGGWDLKFQRWQSVATLKLRAGLNFVRLTTKEGNFPRLDRFRLVGVDAADERALARQAADRQLNPSLLANFIADPAQPWPTIAGIEPYLDEAKRQAVADLSARMAQLTATLHPYPLAISVTDQSAAADLPIHIRGGTYDVAPIAPPRNTLRLFDNLLPRPAVPAGHSGRLELAQWLTDPRHPLTARVMVNRIWQGHFGRGIVATPSDFGSRGAAPSHPELLDWLAATFVEKGWSVKQMHRLIMTSHAYRMSSRADEAAARLDPDNVLLSHFSRRRLEVEAIYDAMASTTNKIVRQPSEAALDIDKSKDRMLYVLTSGRAPAGLGMEIRKMWPLFDYDASGAPVAQRPTSTTAAQSLFWLNSPLVKYHADRFAERLLKMDKLVDRQRVNEAYLLALGRMPSKEVNDAAQDFIRACGQEDGATPIEAWSRFCQALYGGTEFRYVD